MVLKYHPLEWLKMSPGGIDPLTVGWPEGISENTANDIAEFVSHGKNIVHVEPELIKLLSKTSIAEIIAEDIQVPYDAFYMHFGEVAEIFVPESESDSSPDDPIQLPIEGAYVTRTRDGFEFDAGTFGVTLVPAFCDGLSEEHLTYSISLELYEHPSGYIRENARDSVINRYMKTFENPWRVENQLFWKKDGVSVEEQEKERNSWSLDIEHARWKSTALEALSLVVNVILFLNSEYSDIVEEFPASTPARLVEKTKSLKPKEARRATSKLESMGFTKVKVIGRSLQSRAESQSASDRPKSHWGRGHWRRQPHGGRESNLRRLVWIKPTVVNAGSSPENTVQGHIYSVKDK